MFQQKKRQHPQLNKFLADLTIGGLAATLAKVIGSPIEKARLMIGNRQPTAFNSFGTPDAVRISSLFKDLRRYVYPQAMNFALFGQFRHLLVPKTCGETHDEQTDYVLRTSIAGGLAGLTSLVLAYPFHLVQLQMLRAKSQIRTSQILRYITKKYGMGGFYLGIGFSLPIVSIYRAIYFGGYFSAKELLPPEKTEQRDIIRRFLIAQGFATLASAVVYPLQIVRSDMIHKYKMLQTGGLKSWFSCLRAIWRTSGTRGLYQGFSTTLFTTIASSFTLVFFDEIQNYLSGEKLNTINNNQNNSNNKRMLALH